MCVFDWGILTTWTLNFTSPVLRDIIYHSTITRTSSLNSRLVCKVGWEAIRCIQKQTKKNKKRGIQVSGGVSQSNCTLGKVNNRSNQEYTPTLKTSWQLTFRCWTERFNFVLRSNSRTPVFDMSTSIPFILLSYATLSRIIFLLFYAIILFLWESNCINHWWEGIDSR